MQNSKYLLFIFFIAGVFFSSCSKFTKLQKSTNVEEKYQAAVNYYTKKDYNKASLLFEEIIPLIQGTPEAERAQFYLANAHFQQRDYILSAHYFKKFYETYSRSEFAEEAMYLYAYSLYEDSPSYNLDQTNTYTAIEAMQTFINAYPGSKYKEKCNEIIALLRAKLERKAYENAELYSHKEDYKAAVVAFENFQRSYPDSDYNERAAYLKLVNAYNLAKSSTEAKKRERYESTIEYYENFIDKYANSRYMREAENIYEACVKIVGESAGAELQSTKK